MTKTALISVIIVNWNGKHYLKDCFTSLFDNEYKNIEVILVDNASTDDSISYTKKNFPHVKVVHNNNNVGFALGNNVGYTHASGEYILFLNNDTYVTKSFLTKLVDTLNADPRLGGVQSKILRMSDYTQLDSVGAFLTDTGFLYHYGYLQKDQPRFNKKIYLYTAKGACMLFRKSVIKKVGLFDPEFFAYFEETDFCHRVWLAGYTIGYVPQSVIYHKIGGTSNSMNNAFIQFHSFKNRIKSYVKNLSIGELLKILPLHLLLCEMAAISFLLKGKFNLFIAIQKAIGWNLTHISRILRERRYIQQSIRKVPDSMFIPMLKKNQSLKYYYSLFTNSLNGYQDTYEI